jgi:hypothetical protein
MFIVTKPLQGSGRNPSCRGMKGVRAERRIFIYAEYKWLVLIKRSGRKTRFSALTSESSVKN